MSEDDDGLELRGVRGCVIGLAVTMVAGAILVAVFYGLSQAVP